MSIKLQLYQILINKKPIIRQKYNAFVQQNMINGKRNHIKEYAYVILLNFRYLNHKDSEEILEEIVLPLKNESSMARYDLYDRLEGGLDRYDIISFDIFDTLIFRPFSSPTDLFYLIGEKLNYMDFVSLRINMEAEVRMKKFKEKGNYEVNLHEIYQYLEKQVGISAEEGFQAEIEKEHTMCFANPYIYKLYQMIKERGKRIIIISDMYLPESELKYLLKKCGYDGYEKLYVSCEYGKSKSKGELYHIVKEEIGENLRYLHIGDNRHSDIEMAQKKGFSTFWYRNVNELGMKYRTKDMSSMVGAAYRGIVNAHLFNGLKEYSLQYEYGYICGGIFVLGYCMFIHEYVEKNGIEKILFLARDGDILNQVYTKLFPEANTEYVYWSRMAAIKLSSKHYKYDYFRRFIWHKVDSGQTVFDVMRAMNLEDMIQETGVASDEKLNRSCAKKLENYLGYQWESVQNHYKEEREGAKKYYTDVLRGCKKVCAVDVGWAGSGAIMLDYLVNREWNINCEVIGMVAGTNTKNNFEAHASESMFQSRKLVSYMYDEAHNRDLWKYHNPGKDHNIYMELLLSSTKASLKGFCLSNSEKGYGFLFSDKGENKEMVKEIQCGILDFVEEYVAHFKNDSYMFYISGRDAYAPFLFVTLNGKRYMKEVTKGSKFSMFVE